MITFGSEHVDTICRAGRQLIRRHEKLKPEGYEAIVEEINRDMATLQSGYDPYLFLHIVNSLELYRVRKLDLFMSDWIIDDIEYHKAILEQLARNTNELTKVYISATDDSRYVGVETVFEALRKFQRIQRMVLSDSDSVLNHLDLFASLPIRSLKLRTCNLKQLVFRLIRMNSMIEEINVLTYGWDQNTIKDCMRALSVNTNLKV